MTYRNKTITKHIRGNWFARVRHNGKPISIYGRTQLEAYNKLKAFVGKTGGVAAPVGVVSQPTITSKPAASNSYTLKQWFDEWLTAYKAGNVRAVTIKGFKKDFKYLQKLYDTEISGITNIMLSKAINGIAAYRMRDKVHNLLKQIFAVAFNNRLIESNPAANLPRPPQMAVREKRAFTQDQEKRFIEICLQNPKYEPLLICVLQGLRKGEMFALRPNDFDFERDILRIDESYDEKNPEDLRTKNRSSNRKMPMFGLTRQLLFQYRNADPDKRIYNFSSTMLWDRLKKLLEQNGLPYLTVQELRHTFITRCHEKGIDEIVVQKWVGHTIGSRTTKAVYTHVCDDAERKYIEILNGDRYNG